MCLMKVMPEKRFISSKFGFYVLNVCDNIFHGYTTNYCFFQILYSFLLCQSMIKKKWNGCKQNHTKMLHMKFTNELHQPFRNWGVGLLSFKSDIFASMRNEIYLRKYIHSNNSFPDSKHSFVVSKP